MGGSSSAPSPVKFKTADAETFITMMTWRKMKDWKRSWLICLLFLRMEKCSKKKKGGLGGGRNPCTWVHPAGLLEPELCLEKGISLFSWVKWEHECQDAADFRSKQPNSRAGHVRSHTHSWAPDATVLLNVLKSLQSSSTSSCLTPSQRTWEALKIEPGCVNLEVNKPSSY